MGCAGRTAQSHGQPGIPSSRAQLLSEVALAHQLTPKPNSSWSFELTFPLSRETAIYNNRSQVFNCTTKQHKRLASVTEFDFPHLTDDRRKVQIQTPVFHSAPGGVPRLELSLPQLKLLGTVSPVLLDLREALMW